MITLGRTKEFEINEVLDKAVQLFWKQGYEKTSMQDLVDFMGIHRRSIYGTFGDKHALYMKALKRYESTQNKKLRGHFTLSDECLVRTATMVKTATEQRKLTSIMHTILNTLD